MGGMEGGSTCLWVGVAGSDTSLPLRRMEGGRLTVCQEGIFLLSQLRLSIN